MSLKEKMLLEFGPSVATTGPAEPATAGPAEPPPCPAVLNHSPSAVKVYRDCPRKYAYKYVLGIKDPPSDKQEFGLRVHSILENWLEAGEIEPSVLNTPEGKTAMQGIEKGYLPTPSKDLLIERYFRACLDRDEDVLISGYIDCVSNEYNIPMVIDHKTTSSMRYAMEPHEMIRDPQALMYALFAGLYFGETKILARWVYYSASNPASGKRKANGCKKVEEVIDLTRPGLFDDLFRDLNEMTKIRRGMMHPADCQKSIFSCGKFGGCPYIEMCDS